MSRSFLPSQSLQSISCRNQDERAHNPVWGYRYAISPSYEIFKSGVLWAGPSLIEVPGALEIVTVEPLASGEAEGDTLGLASYKKIIGVTRDSAGAPLGSCVVQGYLTGTDRFLRELTSDPGGYFEFPTEFPSPTQHYLVAYKPGSPDVTGASVNTLTAS